MLGSIKQFLKYLYLKCFKVKHFDDNVFRDKTVAIVGPADSILDEELASYIDSFDIVIRINKGFDYTVSHSKFVGTKTNVIFHGGFQKLCGPIKSDLWFTNGINDFVYAEYPENIKKSINRILEINSVIGKLNFFQINPKQYREIKKLLNGLHPSTGFTAIYSVLKSNAKFLYITGFTFYKTAYLDENYTHNNENILGRLIKGGFHNPELEFELFKELYNQNQQKIILDKRLNIIIKNNL